VAEALAFLNTQKRVDIILLDLMMPPGPLHGADTTKGATTGLELRKAMKERYPGVPIVLLTNVNSPELLHSGIEESGIQILHKFTYPPFELADALMEFFPEKS